MKSTNADATFSAARTTRVSTYMVPLVAIPTMLVVPVAGEPSPRPSVVRLATTRGESMSPLGIALDREIASYRGGILEALERANPAVEEVVLERRPKRTQRRHMKVIKRHRPVRLIESPDELEALLAGNGY